MHKSDLRETGLGIILCFTLFILLSYAEQCHTEPVKYEFSYFTSSSMQRLEMSSAYVSKLQPELIYYISLNEFNRFNTITGDIKLIVGCEYYEGCYSEYNFAFTNQSYEANRITLKLQNFHMDESRETVYFTTASQVFVLYQGFVTLLSKPMLGEGKAEYGTYLSNTTFTSINSISKDDIGNLYIADISAIYRVDVNGKLSLLTASKDSDSITKNDGFANETSFSRSIAKIEYYKGYLYGIDYFSIFKINLLTGWMTVIGGRNVDGQNFNEGPALNASLISLTGFAIDSRDDSISVILSEALKWINTKSGNISTLFHIETNGVNPNIFSPNYLFTVYEIHRINRDLAKNTPILSVNGALEDGVKSTNRYFQSITAVAFNESSNEIVIADSSLGYNLQKVDLAKGTISSFGILNRLSNISCWNSSDVTTQNIVGNLNPINSLQIRNSNLYVSTSSMIQKLDFSKRSNGCFFAGRMTSDRLFKKAPPSSIILKNPNGLSCGDSYSTVYIADTGNHRILKYDKNSNMVETIAGNGVPGFSGDGGLAINALLDRPYSVHFDLSSRNIYIADTGNNRIRMISSNGIISTIVGTGVGGFNGDDLNSLDTQLNFPKFVTYDSTIDRLFISDTNNNRIRVSVNNTITTILGKGIIGSKIVRTDPMETQLFSPFGLHYFSETLFVVDTYNHRVLALRDSIVTKIAGTGTPGYNGDGSDPKQAKLFQPSMVQVTRTATYITDTFNNRIRQISDGVISSTSYLAPIGICLNGQNNYLATSENQIFSKSEIGKILGSIGDGLNSFYADLNPTKLLIRDNDVVITESDSNRIRIIDNNGTIRTLAGTGEFGFAGDGEMLTSTKLASPTGLFQFENHLYFADTSNNRIRAVFADTIIFTIAGTGAAGNTIDGTDAIYAKLNTPRIVTALGNGEVLIGDSLNSKVFIIRNSDKKMYTLATSRTSILKATPYCKDGYQLVNANTECAPVCFGFSGEETCSRRGNCISPNQCSCIAGLYTGAKCEIPICYGIAANESSVCSYLNGTCGLNNLCKCRDGFYGDTCQYPICFSQIIGESCGGTQRGACIHKDKCSCGEFYTGERCEFRKCSGKSENDTQVCNGHGKCIENGRCQCNPLYSGNDCSDVSQLYALGISAAVVVMILIVLVVVSLILGLVVYRKNRKERKILETDLSLDERLLSYNSYEMSNSTSLDHSNIEDPNSFVIPLHKIGMDKPIKRLGEGGIGSVFMSKYNGMIVAVKVFDMNNMNISEDDFKNEAILLSKLRNPNIINFFGISTSPTKRYIIMECLDQSMEKVIANLEFKQTKLSLEQKLKMILNIANGIEYLHGMKPKKIIHRDLKPQNILLDSNGNLKICDFGLGKTISQATVSPMTNQLGTFFYMAPEMFDVHKLDPAFATAVDIYSFSIVVWQLLFEIKDPYFFKSPEILKKLRTEGLDPQVTSYQLTKMICENNYRPPIPFDSMETCQEWCKEFMQSDQQYYGVVFNLSLLIQECWHTNPKQRPSIEQVVNQLQSLEIE